MLDEAITHVVDAIEEDLLPFVPFIGQVDVRGGDGCAQLGGVERSGECERGTCQEHPLGHHVVRQDEYGTTGADDFAALAHEHGLEIVTRESFTHGDRDFTGQLARIRAEDPDAVLLWALGDDLGALTRQLRQAGL